MGNSTIKSVCFMATFDYRRVSAGTWSGFLSFRDNHDACFGVQYVPELCLRATLKPISQMIQLGNVVETIINHPFGNGLYHLVMMIWGMV